MWPTSRLALVTLAAAGAAIVAGFWDSASVVATLAWALVVPVLWDFLRLKRQPLPVVTISGVRQATQRRPFELPLDVAHVGGRLEAAIDWPAALGGPVSPVTLTGAGGAAWRAVPRRRGVFSLGSVWLRVESPLGFWARRVIRPTTAQVSVWPDLRGPADDNLGLELTGEGAATGFGSLQVGSDLRGLRPFRSGDDPRHVDWKRTARLATPVIREWQPDRRRSVLIALDAGRLMRAEHDGESKLDAGLRALARVALAAEARGDSVGAVVYADQVRRFIPPLSGTAQAERLLRSIGELEPVAAESDLSRALVPLLSIRRKSLVVVVTDVMDGSGAEALTAAVLALSREHVPVVALLRDPYLDLALARRVDAPEVAFARAAAELVSRERNAALDLLKARGVVAFDLSMREVALVVVQAYVEAKRRGRW